MKGAARLLVLLGAGFLVVGGYHFWRTHQRAAAARIPVHLESHHQYIVDLCCCRPLPQGMTANDAALKAYEVAKRNDNHEMKCRAAYCVAEAFRPYSKEQFVGPTTTDIDSYRKWKAVEKEDCTAAGLTPLSE